ncbi:NADPH-dependent FMN reductase [Cognatishimia sp. WU-CL00825]|uniref:NADPH-dependent FMN reductase n=1 Tax=Cognatishimia sp. WU-CL00825 TaxID=3127658 RepID=UPI0031051DD4
MTNILFIYGSLRKQSSSKALTKALAERLGGQCHVTIAQIGDFPHFNSDVKPNSAVSTFIDQIAAADGVVIVTPEYNYSVPGPLKNAIDWASRPALNSVFKGKPVFVISVSAGALGGVRAQAHLKYILNGMLAQVFPSPEIVVAHSVAAVEDGKFTNDATLDFASENLRGFLDLLGASENVPA